MRYLIAVTLFVAYAYLGGPVYAAEQLTPSQMDQVTAGAFKFQLNRYIAFSRAIADATSSASATNTNTTVQRQGSGG